MERVCFATIIVATLMLHGFEPPPCPVSGPTAVVVTSGPTPIVITSGPAAPANSASPAGARVRGREAETGTPRSDRPAIANQPRHRLATLRRAALDRGRRSGQRVGGRGTAHTGQGALGSSAQRGLRLHPARWRRPGF